MANETVSDKKTPPKPDDGRVGIPVKELRFSRPNGVEIPVDVHANGLRWKQTGCVTAGSKDGDKTEIEFQPWCRRYRVSRTLKTGGAFTFSIHESWAVAVE
jgi:hypothetical protein